MAKSRTDRTARRTSRAERSQLGGYPARHARGSARTQGSAFRRPPNWCTIAAAMDYYGSRRLSHVLFGGLRGLFRFILFATCFVAAAVVIVAARAVAPAYTVCRRRALRRRLGIILTAAAGIKVVRRGRPAGAAGLLVSNHLSWADSFVFLAETGSRFVADSAYEAIPILRTVLSAAGVVYINRRSLRDVRSVGNRMRRAFAAGDPVVVYPEADTSRGERVLPFRSGLLEPAIAADVPVCWAALRYRTPSGWPPSGAVVSWADWTPLLLHMVRAFHPPRIEAQITYGHALRLSAAEREHPRRARREMARRLEASVRSVFRPQAQRSHVTSREPAFKSPVLRARRRVHPVSSVKSGSRRQTPSKESGAPRAPG